MKMTATEALAELKTIAKRVEKKRQFVNEHLLRAAATKDPMEKDGGTAVAIARELQGIGDLERRVVSIRTAIQQMNLTTPVTVSGETRTLAEWLTWRKEVAPAAQAFIAAMRQSILQNRRNWSQKAAQTPGDQSLQMGLEVHVDEAALARDAERIETILGTLDGQLSLKNATILIEIAD